MTGENGKRGEEAGSDQQTNNINTANDMAIKTANDMANGGRQAAAVAGETEEMESFLRS